MSGMSMSDMSMSGMSMSMSGMNMASSSTTALTSSTHSSMNMASMTMSSSSTAMHHSSMSMSMPSSSMSSGMSMSMPSSTVSMPSSNTSSMVMSTSTGMSMDDKMMNSWLTPTYHNYPVLFQKLHANTSGKAFGIFLLIVVTAFVYKFLLYVSWCLEVHWFKKWTNADGPEPKDVLADGTSQVLPKMPNFMFDLFCPSLKGIFHDFIRALLTFCSTMLIYMLMLVAMSFVLTYVFAVITGLALAEVFFNRCKICTLKRWEIQRQIKSARNCPGYGNCQCGRHIEREFGTTTTSSNEKRQQMQDEANDTVSEDATPGCCCQEGEQKEQQEAEERAENNILENSRLQEQAGNMDANLMPAEKFR